MTIVIHLKDFDLQISCFLVYMQCSSMHSTPKHKLIKSGGSVDVINDGD